MSITRRLDLLTAALAAQPGTDPQEAAKRLATMADFTNSDRFGTNSDHIAKPGGSHTTPCATCTANYWQQQAIAVVSAIEALQTGEWNLPPISRTEWEARGRWWPETPTCQPQSWERIPVKQ